MDEVEFQGEIQPICLGGWRQITVDATLLDNSESTPMPLPIARASAYLISIAANDNFQEKMNEISEGCYHMAKDLFGSDGDLLPRLQTGVWSRGFPNAAFLLIDKLYVEQTCRRQGIGRRLVQELLTRVRVERERHSFYPIVPTLAYFERDMREKLRNASEKEARILAAPYANCSMAFWHSLGFHFVGNTSYMAWHPSEN